jgi:AraC-like DNA-binding protein
MGAVSSSLVGGWCGPARPTHYAWRVISESADFSRAQPRFVVRIFGLSIGLHPRNTTHFGPNRTTAAVSAEFTRPMSTSTKSVDGRAEGSAIMLSPNIFSPRCIIFIIHELFRSCVEDRLAYLARECGLSAFQFSRAFRRTVGETPHQWLIRQRIERAKSCSTVTSRRSQTLRWHAVFAIKVISHGASPPGPGSVQDDGADPSVNEYAG